MSAFKLNPTIPFVSVYVYVPTDETKPGSKLPVADRTREV